MMERPSTPSWFVPNAPTPHLYRFPLVSAVVKLVPGLRAAMGPRAQIWPDRECPVAAATGLSVPAAPALPRGCAAGGDRERAGLSPLPSI
ncbi:hypothetical protein GCM10009678_54510 [Actinomadura kijaniata]